MRLDAIREVFDHAGPFVTVHAEVSRSTADAVAQRESRWTTVRNDLRQAGVAAELVAEIGERLNENTHLPGEVRRTVVAAGGEVVLDEVQRGHSHWPELHDVAPLPQLAPWLAVEDSAYCFLLVNADRVGADLSLHRTLREPPVLEKVVDGEEFGLSKVPEGDWAQKEFQQSAENTWRQNATLVADAVDELVREHRPAAVLLAGETRARAEVQRAFAARGEIPTPHEVESGGRAAGASQAALWAEVRTVVDGLVAERDAAVAARLDEARGRGEGSATGIDEVAEALAQSKVEQLAVDLDALAERTVPTERLVGVALPDAAQQQRELPADRALVAAAALTGASLSVLPSTMSRGGGASALLRWG